MAGTNNLEVVIRIDNTLTVAAQNYTVARAFVVSDFVVQSNVTVGGGSTVQASNNGVALSGAVAGGTVDVLTRPTTVVAAQAVFAAAGTLRTVSSSALANTSTFFSVFPTPGIAG